MSAFRIGIVTMALAACTVPAGVDAQPRWTLEVSPAAGFVTDDPPDFDFGLGFGGEASLLFRIQPQVALYGGWDWHRFASDAADAGDDTLEVIGYAFGVRFEHPVGVAGSPAIMIRVGGTWNRLEFNTGEADDRDSRGGIGWEIGGGLAIPVGARWTVTPAVRFRAASHDIVLDDGTASASLGYALAELGLGLRF